MGFQNIGVLEKFLRCVVDDRPDFILRFLYSDPEPIDFIIYLIIGDRILFDDIDAFPIDYVGLTNADAG